LQPRPEGELAVEHVARKVKHVISPPGGPISVIYRQGSHMAKISETSKTGETLGSEPLLTLGGFRAWCNLKPLVFVAICDMGGLWWGHMCLSHSGLSRSLQRSLTKLMGCKVGGGKLSFSLFS